MFQENNTLFPYLKGALLAFIAFISISVICILLFPLLLLLFKDPQKFIPALGIGTLIISSMTSGAICSHYSKNLFSSLTPSIPAILLILTGSLFFKESTISFGLTMGSYIAIPIAFLTGGTIIHFISKRRPKRRKRYR